MPEITDPALLQQLNSGPTQRPPRPSGARPIMLSPGDPNAQRKSELDIQGKQIGVQTDAATAPYAGPQAAADLEARRIANEKARRELEAQQQAAPKPEQQKRQLDLSNDEIMAAIQRAKNDLQVDRSAGYWARLPEMLQPQAAINLGGSLNTIASRLTLDKLSELKSASATGASGLGALSEREGALLRDSVAALGQTQDPQRLLENLNEVENHYRNMMILSNGEDFRDPAVAERYGIVNVPPGQEETPDWSLAGTGGGDGGQLTSEGKWQDDPALRGVNSRVSQMIKSGASAGQVRAYLDSVQPGLGARTQNIEDWVRFSNQHPQAKINVDVERAWVPTTGLTRAAGEIGMTAPGQFAISAANALTAGTLDNLTDSPAATRAAMAANAADNPTADFLGGLAGNVVGTAGVGKALGMFGRGAQWARTPALADLVYGGAYGAGSADEGSRLTGALTGAAENYLGAKAGQKVGSAFGSSLTGVTDPAVQYLNRMGVRMTPGQMAGGRLKSMEDRWTGNAGLGDRINDLRRRSITDWNEALYRDAYAPVGYTPTATGEAGVTAGRGAVSDFYNRTLDPVSVSVDEPFMAGISRVKQAGANIPGELAGEIDNTLKTRVGPFIDPQTSQITGRNYQAIRQGVQGDMSDFSGVPRYDLYRDQAGNILDELDDLFRRQSPGTTEALGKANEAWRNNSILEDAVIAARNNDGIIMPSQLGNAVVSNAKKYGGKGLAASEDRPFFELQRAGQNVLPSKVPDSGTAGRAREGSPLSKAAGMAVDAVRSPLYSETLEPLFRAGLLERPQFMIDAGEKVKKYSRLPGMFGGGLALQYLGSQ